MDFTGSENKIHSKLIFRWIFDIYHVNKFWVKKIETVPVKQKGFNVIFSQTERNQHSVGYQFYNTTKSWNDASQLCKKIGGYLPYFTSRQDLEDLFSLLMLSQDIPPIAYMYIGLKYNSNQVVHVKIYIVYFNPNLNPRIYLSYT